jgi:(p)ppGpp synthase/HD superfamily hydrolase
MIRKEIKQDGMMVYAYVCQRVKESCEATHAYNVAMNTVQTFNKDSYFCVALLHDIVEDGYACFEELQQRFDLDDEQMAALDAITRRHEERYFDYIERCKQNEMAKTVKLADLQDNIRRCAFDLQNRWEMLRRYAKAYGILIGAWKENERP